MASDGTTEVAVYLPMTQNGEPLGRDMTTDIQLGFSRCR